MDKTSLVYSALTFIGFCGFVLLPFPFILFAGILLIAFAWFLYDGLTNGGKLSGLSKYVLKFGGVKWVEADFCRGWEIDGQTGSGKTASGVVPIIHNVKMNRSDVGILALDTKGDLSEPLAAIAQDLNCGDDLRQLEVRPDNAGPKWKPPFTMNFLSDPSIPSSTYAKMLVDVATAAGQRGGQAFFKSAAKVLIQNGLIALHVLRRPVTLTNLFVMVSNKTALDTVAADLKKPEITKCDWLRAYFDDLLRQPAEQFQGTCATVFNYLEPFTHPDIAEIFNSPNPTFDLNEIDSGKLISIRIPQKYQTEKRYVSLLLKALFYTHALRRYDLSSEERAKKNLIVLVLDEAQETVLVSEDGLSDYNVIDKIRGARATTINSTQSPTSYIPPMGARDKAEVFLLNLANRVHFTAADKDASEMIADAMGKHTVQKKTHGYSGGKSSLSWTDQDEHIIKPHELRGLPKHVAVIKHCAWKYCKRVKLSPSQFTKPADSKAIAPTSPEIEE